MLRPLLSAPKTHGRTRARPCPRDPNDQAGPVFDDWLLSPITLSEARDILEILDDRYDRRSTLICTQIPVDQWHGLIPEPTLAEAILDRLVHNAYRLQMDGESKRRARGLAAEGTLDPSTNP